VFLIFSLYCIDYLQVILREHFRCAPEIIAFSNSEFYNDALVSLRLPTSSERLKPSLIDVRIPNGAKVGKVNERECDEIVRMIKEYVESCPLCNKRTIGIISLMGDEQSRLVRGRLLDAIGPQKYKLHDVLIGDPPAFQGAERDIIYLSLVCSPGRVPTQNQLMHAQRANVALSRARDRMVLVRSIDVNHIPNEQDMKLFILDFFEKATMQSGEKDDSEDPASSSPIHPTRQMAFSTFRARAERLLEQLLKERGFSLHSMGVVWEGAICVEDSSSSARAAICVEGSGETQEEWTRLVEQQKSIERVGWKCLRVDALSLLSNYQKSLDGIVVFLALAGVDSTTSVAAEGLDVNMDAESNVDGADEEENRVPPQAEADAEVVVISSDDGDDDDDDDRKPAAVKPDRAQIAGAERLGNGELESDYGNVVGLNFLLGSNRAHQEAAPRRQGSAQDEVSSVGSDEHIGDQQRAAIPGGRRRLANNEEDDIEEKQRAVSESTKRTFSDDISVSSDDGGEDYVVDTTSPPKRRRTRLDKYSQDARWYPTRNNASEEEDDVQSLPKHSMEQEAEEEKGDEEMVKEEDVMDVIRSDAL
jgi:hypothetical protein